MKAKLLKQVRKRANTIKLVRWITGEYLITDNPADPFRKSTVLIRTGTFYFGSLPPTDEMVDKLYDARKTYILKWAREGYPIERTDRTYKVYPY